jgi:hypothetical protein
MVASHDALHGLPVLLRDVCLGHVIDVVLDAEGRTVGLLVRSLAGRTHVLPVGLADAGADGIVIESPLHLMDDLADYLRRGVLRSTLDGRSIT